MAILLKPPSRLTHKMTRRVELNFYSTMIYFGGKKFNSLTDFFKRTKLSRGVPLSMPNGRSVFRNVAHHLSAP